MADQDQFESVDRYWDPITAKSIEISRVPRRVGSRYDALIEKRMEEISIIEKQGKLEELLKDKMKAADQVTALQIAHDSIRDEAEPVVKKLADLRVITDPLEQKVCIQLRLSLVHDTYFTGVISSTIADKRLFLVH